MPTAAAAAAANILRQILGPKNPMPTAAAAAAANILRQTHLCPPITSLSTTYDRTFINNVVTRSSIIRVNMM